MSDKRKTYREVPPPAPPDWLRRRKQGTGKRVFVEGHLPAARVTEPPSIRVEEDPPVEYRRGWRGELPWWGWAWIFWVVFLALAMWNSKQEETPAMNAATFVFGIICIPLLAFGYVLPTVIAVKRGHPNAIPIGIVNVVFGWLLIGYVAALAWAFTAIPER